MEKIKRYIYGKIANQKAYYIRPIDWAGIWNENNELKQGLYSGLFNEENDAKIICEQLNKCFDSQSKLDNIKALLEEVIDNSFYTKSMQLFSKKILDELEKE